MTAQRVLVVDDEEDLLELVRYNLSKEGYQVHCVASGEEAIQVARSLLPDLILLDLMLPAVDGLGVCKVLKGSPPTQHIPIVMITAKTAESDVVSGLELGADDYITKPFSPRVLLARIRAVLAPQAATALDEDNSTVRGARDGDPSRASRSAAARPAGRSDLHRVPPAAVPGA